ncbi:hypothetical protein BpHYR1_023768 [Brachionus plicatilis]|uniref:Uncharacterized protein n=1 Tax=Brachionus plicatilis TaxID=10195 RepID=A0A3M7SN66_BRAPC|nr:hypothetical protein BpHYR1_023768 [Brachionus plicatilis]
MQFSKPDLINHRLNSGGPSSKKSYVLKLISRDRSELEGQLISLNYQLIIYRDKDIKLCDQIKNHQ